MTYLLAFRGLLGRIPWQVWAILGLGAAVMFYGNHREAENRDRTERFIASGGVRNACPGGGQAPRAGAGSGEGVHQAPVMDDPETVSVKPDDVRICTANTLTAEALQAYLMGLDYPER
jgi:hypothetical protein